MPPGAGGTFLFGLVTEADELKARQLVLAELAKQGLDISEIDPNEIGLVLWQEEGANMQKGHLYFG